MTTKTEMTLENVKAGDRVICRKELSHPTFIIWKEYDIVIQGESLYIVSHTYDLFSINESTLEIINEHFTLVTREDVITLSNAAFMYIKGEQDSESIRKIYDEKVTDEINKIWWLNHHYYSLIHGILSPSMHEPNRHILSASDYLKLLLSAPESQAHLLTEKDRHELEYSIYSTKVTWCPICKEHFYIPESFHIVESKLASQPPVMEGREETLQDVIKRVSPFGTMTISNPKMLIALEDFIGQKTKSLQSEVEQLKGLLKEAQPFCGTMLRGKIEHYTSK